VEFTVLDDEYGLRQIEGFYVLVENKAPNELIKDEDA